MDSYAAGKLPQQLSYTFNPSCPPLKIAVTGRSFVAHTPERGTLNFSVKSTGPVQEDVAREVTSTSNNLQTWFKSNFNNWSDDATEPPMTKFSSNRIKTWTRARDQYDKPVPDPYNASISFRAVFRDFTKLNIAIDELLRYPKVEIDFLDWTLTDETGRKLDSEARKLALRNAIQQADDYSEVLGRGAAVVEISDQGSSYRARHKVAASYVNYPGAEPVPLDLTPHDVEVEGNVDVTFEAV
ncbi:hypothetical protein N7457_009594 [Penicillium paradoxum]|uniref:uncharacterized protein n=1 Tax=Penicillium paradoxum TaxID=176176 RepID=UPI002548C3A0|nr:uncharacterized protein N7457_009594 [Penicillium paradoxum]KAJ5774698.1 hypothetical protein N7457_009594 [Penicillium paradoxum]